MATGVDIGSSGVLQRPSWSALVAAKHATLGAGAINGIRPFVVARLDPSRRQRNGNAQHFVIRDVEYFPTLSRAAEYTHLWKHLLPGVLAGGITPPPRSPTFIADGILLTENHNTYRVLLLKEEAEKRAATAEKSGDESARSMAALREELEAEREASSAHLAEAEAVRAGAEQEAGEIRRRLVLRCSSMVFSDYVIGLMRVGTIVNCYFPRYFGSGAKRCCNT